MSSGRTSICLLISSLYIRSALIPLMPPASTSSSSSPKSTSKLRITVWSASKITSLGMASMCAFPTSDSLSRSICCFVCNIFFFSLFYTTVSRPSESSRNSGSSVGMYSTFHFCMLKFLRYADAGRSAFTLAFGWHSSQLRHSHVSHYSYFLTYVATVLWAAGQTLAEFAAFFQVLRFRPYLVGVKVIPKPVFIVSSVQFHYLN